MTEPTAEQAPSPTVIDGRYQLRKSVGGGLIVTIWSGRDLILGREVEVKLWRDDSSESIAAHDEEMSALRAEDPSLGRLLDAGLHKGRPYLVSDPGPIDDDSPATAAHPRVEHQPTPPVTVAPTVSPDPTPPGTPAIRRNGSRTTGLIVGAVAVAVVLVTVGLIVRPPTGPGASPSASLIEVAYASSTFDPEGDGAENPNELAALSDGTPSTAWSTDRYSSRKFGNLKSGLGLVIVPSRTEGLTELTVFTTTTGWAAQIHVADAPAAGLAGWGAPVATVGAGSVSEVFALPGSTVGAVLVWFTDLGDSSRLSVSELVLRAPGE